jgi:hypothetical protein
VPAAAQDGWAWFFENALSSMLSSSKHDGMGRNQGILLVVQNVGVLQ